MKTLRFLLEKEFKQVLRSRQLLRTLMIAPVIQLILLPLAADYSVKNISIAVVDNDHSTFSVRLINKITASGHFKLTGYASSFNEALKMVEQDQADLAIEIPANFEKTLVREDADNVFIAINAIEGTKANLGGGYLGSIVADFNNDIRINWMPPVKTNPMPMVTVASSNWYNIFLNYKLYMVPAILVSLVTALASIQAAFNIVQEKEKGTIEQINVSPIKKYIFIIGKMIPFLVLATIVFSIGLFLAWLIYGIIPVGNLIVLYVSLMVYLVAMLGLGLLISTYSATQQQAFSLSFFFMNIFNMMSGTFSSIDSMPQWAKNIVATFPQSHFIKIMRMVVLKGSGFSDISGHILAMLTAAVVLNTWAILNYRKTT